MDTVVISNPAAMHRRTLALVRHYRNADIPALGALISELTEPDDAGAAIASLVQLVSWALDDHPLDADEWLDSVAQSLPRTDTTS
jgi:hypothetical protein